MAKQPRDWTPVEIAYSAWLRAAREAAGSGAAVVRAMQTHLERNDLLGLLDGKKRQKWSKYGPPNPDGQPRRRSWQGTAFTQWEKGRKDSPVPGIPADEVLRDALVAVVSDLVDRVPAASADWATFRGVFDAFLAERELSRQGSGNSAKARGEAKREHEDRNILGADPGAAKDLDPLALGLGSWVFDGDLPTYIPRTPDALLAEQLTGEPGVTVVVGPPKSGKSRSVVQVLQDRVPAARVWWVNPAPGVLPELVIRFKGAATGDQAPEVIVIDDAHLHDVNPTDGLTHARLTTLARTARVIVIVHEVDLAAWQHQVRDRSSDPARRMAGIGATAELVDLLTAHRIDYPAVLDESELATTADLFDESTKNVHGLDLTRLAEVLASVAQLEDKARSAQAAGGMNAALVEAAIDATIAFPAGAGLEWLEQLTRIHYRREEPNKDWDADLFRQALDWATTGIAPRSPHALLIRSGLDNEAFRLLDALAPQLRDADRNLGHLHDTDLPVEAVLNIGWWFFADDRWAPARHWFTRAVSEYNHPRAMVMLGALADRAGDTAAAEAWWRRAADEHDDPEAMYALGIFANTAGDTAAAEAWWLRALDEQDYPDAMFNLGVLASEAGDTAVAEAWWRRAAEHDHPDAMHSLGLLSNRAGDTAAAEAWWRRAAEHDHPDAMHSLGLLSNRAGDTAAAEAWWRRAADEHDHLEAMLVLGIFANAAGDTAAAEAWWLRALDKHKFPDTMYHLGVMACKTGDMALAREAWRGAAERGHADAIRDLRRIGDD